MNIPLAAVIVLGTAGLTGLVFVLLDRRLEKPLVPEAARGGPTLIVTGTMFAVLLAFVTLAAFQTYSGAKSGAASEASAVLDMARTANLFPPRVREELRADFVCYGRAVIDKEWPAMRRGQSSPEVDYWIDAYRAAFARVSLSSPRAQLGLQDLLILANARTVGRQQRLSDDTPAVPTPLWLALVLGGCIAVAVQIGLAGSHVRSHAFLVAGLAALVASGLLVVYFLDHPYEPYTGAIEPAAMHRTLVMIKDLDPGLRPGCTASGQPV